jgi:PAS domain S-box-containing protein
LHPPLLARLDSLIDQKFEDLAQSIALFRAQGANATGRGLLDGSGEYLMDSIRMTMNELGQEKRRAFETSAAEANDRATMALVALAALSLLGLLALGTLFIVISRHLTQRQEAMAVLSQESAQLEERVRERTAALESELRQRREAERARHASETRYRLLVEQVKDHAIFSMAPDGTATSWNEGVQRVLGFTEEEFIGMPAERIFTDEDVAKQIPQRELAYAERHGVANNDRWMRGKDGVLFFANGSTTALRNEKHELVGFSKVMRDQTIAKQTEEALRESETRYRLVALASREAIWDWDLATDTLTWNEGIEILFGYPLERVEPSISWWQARIHPEERQRVIDSRQTAIERGEDFWSADYRFQREDGGYAMVTDRGVVARDENGRLGRMLGTIADVTDRRRTDEKLSQAQRMEAVGRLAGGIAHDLNNMLTAIVGYSSFLEQGLPPGDPRQSDVAEIMKAADRSAALTRSLLAFARREIIQPQPLDLNRIVLEMGRMLRPAMGESIQVEMSLEPIEGTVVADRARVEQVILNIALNARDAMPSGGRLSIATSSVALTEADAARHPGTEITPGRYVKMTISDTGHGMDPETLARIFEPFFTTKGIGEGTGLGLSTVYGTVKQSGGFVWAYSEPGHGSAFTVYLPEAADPALPVRPSSGSVEGTRRGSEFILIVEDEDMVRDLTRRVLEGEGYRCLTAGNGPEALRLVQTNNHPLNLMITDIVMPGMGGRDLARAVRDKYPDARVLFTSGFTDDDVVRRGLMDVGQPFLQKPWSIEELLRRVRNLLDTTSDRTGWDRVSPAEVPMSPDPASA